MTKLIILRGISGSGKSTYADNVLTEGNESTTVIVSADDHFMKDGEYVFNPAELPEAHRRCFMNCDDYLDAGWDVIVDNTNTSLWEISPYMMLAQKHRAEVEIHHVLADPEVAAARNTHGVPEASVEAMAERMEPLLPFWPKEVTVGPF